MQVNWKRATLIYLMLVAGVLETWARTRTDEELLRAAREHAARMAMAEKSPTERTPSSPFSEADHVGPPPELQADEAGEDVDKGAVMKCPPRIERRYLSSLAVKNEVTSIVNRLEKKGRDSSEQFLKYVHGEIDNAVAKMTKMDRTAACPTKEEKPHDLEPLKKHVTEAVEGTESKLLFQLSQSRGEHGVLHDLVEKNSAYIHGNVTIRRQEDRAQILSECRSMRSILETTRAKGEEMLVAVNHIVDGFGQWPVDRKDMAKMASRTSQMLDRIDSKVGGIVKEVEDQVDIQYEKWRKDQERLVDEKIEKIQLNLDEKLRELLEEKPGQIGKDECAKECTVAIEGAATGNVTAFLNGASAIRLSHGLRSRMDCKTFLAEGIAIGAVLGLLCLVLMVGICTLACQGQKAKRKIREFRKRDTEKLNEFEEAQKKKFELKEVNTEASVGKAKKKESGDESKNGMANENCEVEVK